MDRDSATDDTVPDSILCVKLYSDLYWNCIIQPMRIANYSDRFISKGTFRYYPCLTVTACMTGFLLGHLDGLGIGTILAAFTMGKCIGLIGSWMDKRYTFVTVLTKE